MDIFLAVFLLLRDTFFFLLNFIGEGVSFISLLISGIL